MDGTEEGASPWMPPAWREVLRWPLPCKGLGDRMLVKAVALAGKGQVRAIHGIEYVLPERDPFILVANHSTKRDTVVTPALLMLHRGGRPIHYLADWNYRLVPGVGMLYQGAGVITVTRKPARPRFLNAFRRYYEQTVTPIEQARQHLAADRSVGFFPEGTLNRDPDRLLAGRRGAARLSIETGVPIVPMGIRFPEAQPERRIVGPMEMFIGPPLTPPEIDAVPAPYSAVRSWHATLMSEIARLSGKAWRPHQAEQT
jgi:1-acyl-sn-glycerol-3-phosphate acyltransferase